jgi:hypothetical protein
VRFQRDLHQIRLLANKSGVVPPEAVEVIRRAREELREILAASHEPPAPIVDVNTFEPRHGRVPVLTDFPDPMRKLGNQYQNAVTDMLTNHAEINLADLGRNITRSAAAEDPLSLPLAGPRGEALLVLDLQHWQPLAFFDDPGNG